ncbi:hypothetical protein [Levilactobacillus huananensis]|uniref:hypothetical protein n=1 Tax=Levilactobacillus huananensis TaxID=2486019 RepID=UPI000F772C56|nr:hypothetical protein [Levilactobacillus huananensis]
MLRRLWALIILEWQVTWAKKMIFVYTLGIPVIFLLIGTFSHYGHPLGNYSLTNQLFGYWSYMILVGVMSGFQFSLMGIWASGAVNAEALTMNETYRVLLSNLVLQTFVIQLEILIFDGVLDLLMPISTSLQHMMAVAWILNFLLVPIVASFTTIFLLLPVRGAVTSLIAIAYIGGGLLGVNAQLFGQSVLATIVMTILDPCAYVVRFYLSWLNIGDQRSSLNGLLLGIVALGYLMVSVFVSRHLPRITQSRIS